MTESEKFLETVRAEFTSLQNQVVLAGAEKADSDKVLPEFWKKSENLLELLNVTLVGRNRAKNLTRSLVTESVSGIDTVV